MLNGECGYGERGQITIWTVRGFLEVFGICLYQETERDDFERVRWIM